MEIAAEEGCVWICTAKQPLKVSWHGGQEFYTCGEPIKAVHVRRVPANARRCVRAADVEHEFEQLLGKGEKLLRIAYRRFEQGRPVPAILFSGLDMLDKHLAYARTLADISRRL